MEDLNWGSTNFHWEDRRGRWRVGDNPDSRIFLRPPSEGDLDKTWAVITDTGIYEHKGRLGELAAKDLACQLANV